MAIGGAILQHKSAQALWNTKQKYHDACIVCIAVGEGMSWDKAMSNNEEIEPVAYPLLRCA